MDENDEAEPQPMAIMLAEMGDAPKVRGILLESVAATQLHVADVVRHDGALLTVTSLRIQGAPAEVCVEFAGVSGRCHYPPTARFHVVRHRRR